MLAKICYRVIRFVPVVQVQLWSGMLITLKIDCSKPHHVTCWPGKRLEVFLVYCDRGHGCLEPKPVLISLLLADKEHSEKES